MLQAAAVPISPGCTAVAHALAQALSVDKATLPSLISLPVAQSNIATSPSVLLAGQETSPLQVPESHFGIPKFNTAALLVHTFVTVAELHGDNVVVVQTVIVAAAQSFQSAHGVQATHCGIVKSNTAALDVQLFTTVAELQAAQVDTLPTVIVAAEPSAHGVPGSPCSPFRFLY